MASFQKQKNGWRAFVAIKGTRDSCTFSTKVEAQAWASERENTLRKNNSSGISSKNTCEDAFIRYAEKISITKKGKEWEKTKLLALTNHLVDNKPFGDYPISDITSQTLTMWRDERLKTVQGSTVNRELKLLSHVFNIARKEWKWMLFNPIEDISHPSDPPPRDRRISQIEIDKLDYVLGIANAKTTKTGAVAVAFNFAIETAMRLSEICNLTPKDILNNVATLPKTKNGSKREVPLSQRALELLEMLPKDRETVFDLTPSSLDALFRKAKKKALIEDLKFHDTRHEAITRLAKKLNVLELARMVGHRDLKMLMVYFNETAENLAKKLD
jgi:integrase